MNISVGDSKKLYIPILDESQTDSESDADNRFVPSVDMNIHSEVLKCCTELKQESNIAPEIILLESNSILGTAVHKDISGSFNRILNEIISTLPCDSGCSLEKVDEIISEQKIKKSN